MRRDEVADEQEALEADTVQTAPQERPRARNVGKRTTRKIIINDLFSSEQFGVSDIYLSED